MTPEQIAIDQQRLVLAQQQADAYRKEMTFSARINAASELLPVLLDKWLERHRYTDGRTYPVPTPNDMRWLAKMAYQWAAYIPEVAGLCRLDDSKMNVLDKLDPEDAFSFDRIWEPGDKP